MEKQPTTGTFRLLGLQVPGLSLEGYAQGVVLVLAAGLIWSTAGIGIRLVDTADGWQIVFYRALGLVILLSLVMLYRYRGRIDLAVRASGHLGWLCGVCVAVSFIANVYAMLNTSVANVALIMSSTPLFAALLGWLFLRERVGRQTWQAIALTMLGILFMVGTSLALEGPAGILFALVMTVTYAGYTVLTRYGRGRDMLPAFWIAGLLAMVIAAPMLKSFVVTQRDLSLCLFLGAFQGGLGLMLYTFAARHVPAAELPLLAMTEVIFAPLWVWLGVGEIPATWTLIGGAIILAGITLQAGWMWRNSKRGTARLLNEPTLA